MAGDSFLPGKSINVFAAGVAPWRSRAHFRVGAERRPRPIRGGSWGESQDGFKKGNGINEDVGISSNNLNSHSPILAETPVELCPPFGFAQPLGAASGDGPPLLLSG